MEMKGKGTFLKKSTRIHHQKLWQFQTCAYMSDWLLNYDHFLKIYLLNKSLKYHMLPSSGKI